LDRRRKVEGSYGRQQEQTSITREARLILPGVRPATTSDRDIFRAAKLMIDQRGEDASLQAADPRRESVSWTLLKRHALLLR
jgi:hypothetical protein